MSAGTTKRVVVPAGVGHADRAGLGPTLALAAVFALAAMLMLIAITLLLVHTRPVVAGPFTPTGPQQNQHAKTALYALSFALILPLALTGVPRLANRIAAGPNAASLPAFAACLVGAFAAVVIAIRLSGALPWGDGLKGVLLGVVVWLLLAALATRRAIRGEWRGLERLRAAGRVPAVVAAALVFERCLASLTFAPCRCCTCAPGPSREETNTAT